MKIRNPIARAPILKKGGAHVKNKSSQRAQMKKELKKALDDCWNK
jgi:hypothetical protein